MQVRRAGGLFDSRGVAPRGDRSKRPDVRNRKKDEYKPEENQESSNEVGPVRARDPVRVNRQTVPSPSIDDYAIFSDTATNPIC